MASRSAVGWKYCAKCQVWPLRGCGLPRIEAETTPMRYTLVAGFSSAPAREAARADAPARTTWRRVGLSRGVMTVPSRSSLYGSGGEGEGRIINWHRPGARGRL